jgi:hypothetical protein
MDSKTNLVIVFSSVLLLLASCSADEIRNRVNKPSAMGRINQMVVIADQNLQQSDVLDTLTYYFEAAYPVLPAEEPMFDLRYMTVEDLNARPVNREMRTFLVLVDLMDTMSTSTRMLRQDMGNQSFADAMQKEGHQVLVGKDKWAKGQLLIYLYAKGRKALQAGIQAHFAAISKKINEHDQPNLQATVYGIQDENKELSRKVQDLFGFSMRIPGLYQKAMEAPNFLWLRMDTDDMIQSLVFRKFAYRSKNQFALDSIVQLRNEYGAQFIRTGFADAYMSTNVIDLPVLEYTYFHNNMYVKEIRGIWETVNDFKGGPFVSYLIHNEKKGEILFVDAFVFAPGKEKRDYIQQLDCIVKTVKTL